MKFELNEYHRNVSDKELIADVQVTAKELGKNTLTAKEYSQYGTYHSSTLTKRFGSWKTVLELSKLETRGHNFKYIASDEDIITDLKHVASILNAKTVTSKEYDKYGMYSSCTVMKRYGTWNNVLKLAGMKVTLKRNFTDEEMFEEIERIWILLGRQPTTTDIKSGISTFSLQSYARRFGGWRGALQAFIDYINEDFTQNSEDTNSVYLDNSQSTNDSDDKSQVIKHKTRRDINLRLRFMVMQRDNFKCCACGASPAKDSSVELHIDHIIPWSKGGETVIENLQTLCSKCNLGKSDMI